MPNDCLDNFGAAEECIEKGFNNPENTVAITVPITNSYGEAYGSSVEKITPQEAGRRIDADRKSIEYLREQLYETRFWLKLAKQLIGLLGIVTGFCFILIILKIFC